MGITKLFSKKPLERIKDFKSNTENEINIDLLVDNLLIKKTKSNQFFSPKKSNNLKIIKNLFKKKTTKRVLSGFILFLLFFSLWVSSIPQLYGDVGSDIIISLEPREVYNGETIHINVSIPDYYNISSLTADIEGKQTIDLVLNNNESDYHIWNGNWIVHDLDPGYYFADIVGFDQQNIKYYASVDWKIIDQINSDLNETNKTDVNNSINSSNNWTELPDTGINDTLNISIPPELDNTTITNNTSVTDDLNLSLNIEKSKYIINEAIYIRGFVSFNKSYINTSINLSIITPKINIYDILDITDGIIEYEFVPNIEGIYVFNFSVNYKNKSLVKDVIVEVENLYIVNKSDEIENLTNIKTTQYDGIINQAVKWTKEITFKNSKNQIEIFTQNISLPSYAENITVFEKTELNLNENLNVYYKKNNYIQINQTLESNESKIYLINYTTPAPNSTEITISPFKKLVTVSSDFDYTNISAYATINNIPRDNIHLYHRINNKRMEIEFTAIDLDNDSLIDRIEWNIPHLSTQTYEIIIEIIKAEHLDENRKYISEIYNETKSKDNIWSEPIFNKEYVRVIFESELDNNKDITIYARSSGTSQIEVYQMDNDTLITTFENITSDTWYKIFLTNMSSTNTSFDLKTVGDFVEYDYIVDPTGWISPTGYNDPSSQWSTETNAYDGNTATYASHGGGAGWGGFLELTLTSAIYCDRVKVFSDFGYGIVDLVDIDIYNSTSWIDKYQGTISDCFWTELLFSAETNVTQARFRYHYLAGGYQFWLYEFAFWQGQPLTLPSCLTQNATSIDETTAILHGNVTDDGGEPCQFRFEYGSDTSYGNYTSWRGNKVANEEFTEMISGLTLGNTYHYRADIKNSFGENNSTDKNFTTAIPSFGWISPTSNYDSNSKWDNETFSYDDDNDSYARSYHSINDPNGQWSFFIYLNHSSIYCNSVRFYARGLTGDSLTVDQGDLDVRRDGIWVDVLNASFSDKQWVQCNFSQGIVDSVRIRFHINSNSGGLYFELFELDFNKSRPLENITGESPSNQSTGVSLTPFMNITVYNPDGDIMNITWYSNSSGTWQPFGSNLSVVNGTYHQINSNFSSRGVIYWWYVNVSDGLDSNTSGIFYFITQYYLDVITNASTGVEETNATLCGFLLHDGGDTCIVRFEYGRNTSFGTNTTNQTKVHGQIFSDNVNGLIPGALYHYRSFANNTLENDTGNDMLFLTKPNATIAGSLIVQTNSSSILFLTWIKGDGANTTYIERNATAVTTWDRGQGTLIYNNTGTSFQDTGLASGTKYYYQAWSFANWTYNATASYYQFSDNNVSANNKTNNLPTATLRAPAPNGTTGVCIQPLCQIWANDTDGDTLKIDWYENSTGSWILRYTNTSQTANTTASYIFTQFTNSGTTYYWKVAVNDTKDNITNWYYFTTNNAPTQSGASPTNGQTKVFPTPALYIICSDTDTGQTMTAIWTSNSTGTWTTFATNNSINTGTNITQINSNFTNASTTYYWSVNLTDGCTWTNTTYSFTTSYNPVISNPGPSNDSIEQDTTPICNVTVSDSDGGTVTIRFYENTTVSWVLQQTNSSVSVTTPANVVWNNYRGL